MKVFRKTEQGEKGMMLRSLCGGWVLLLALG